jgi:hypothetical protein
MYYKLDGKVPVPCDRNEWNDILMSGKQVLWQDYLNPNNVMVSTIFVGMRTTPDGEPPPRLFETRIFGGPHDGESWWWNTWEEADMHQNVRRHSKR